MSKLQKWVAAGILLGFIVGQALAFNTLRPFLAELDECRVSMSADEGAG